ncbi:hypothetical protein [Agrobacterium tumefaciens]|uniref:hypothetical protein n=1 Tax=Agrobacterium tumefaciens TaxID=358 RepID=UPI0015740CB2|nr:hypothetical protein [Agrobacterium tumefaciens]NTB05441.1 hypothetical protein [Agrobacterium tumefaciens]NTE53227.1 hypothetical protein [Agrobacterium tumefaciens]
MGEFNRMTVVAAAEVISDSYSHSEIDVLEMQWGIEDKGGGSSKSARVVSLSKAAVEGGPAVYTESGQVSLERAMIEKALANWSTAKETASWQKLKAGLRFDGFEIVEPAEVDDVWGRRAPKAPATLVRMLPSDAPELNMREAENEVVQLLRKHQLTTAEGHLSRAMSAFQRGEWSGANGELRNFLESYFNEIAVLAGCDPTLDSRQKRDFLGGSATPPFLLADYNEWSPDGKKSPFVQALMSRMHPHGGHPGLSEEEDATFRLQITLVTARLFLRRFDRGPY